MKNLLRSFSFFVLTIQKQGRETVNDICNPMDHALD